MNIVYKPFAELTSFELRDLFRLRQNVFIIEQDCFYEDIDSYEEKANHLLIYEGKELAAYLRLFPKGAKLENEANLGRIVVAPGFRGTGLGNTLIRKGIELCGESSIRIEAQAALLKYYNKLGFTEKGNIYVVDGIEHIQMTLA